MERCFRNFQQQTYPSLELIVLDDGDDLIADLLPDDSRILYRQTPGKSNHGQKMNRCMELASGEFAIVHDSDDFYAPDRVFRQIAPLLAAPSYDITGLKNLLYYDKAKQQAWRYSDPTATWLGAIAFRRSAWEAKRFAELSSGADLKFQQDHKGKVIAVHGDAIVCAIHETNAGSVGKKITANPKFFTPVEYQEVVDFTGGDL